jgi:putative mRNA 3-end processing factor
VDRGFVISDHCDWQGLNQAIAETNAETVWVTHGYASELVAWLQGQGRDAHLALSPSGDDAIYDGR